MHATRWCSSPDPQVTDPPNARSSTSKTPGRTLSTHRYLRLMEEGVLNGQAVASAAIRLRLWGFVPDVIVAHMGWGEACT